MTSGRKQYRYHPVGEVRDENKYGTWSPSRSASGDPRARRAAPELAPAAAEKVLATVVQLLETTLIRVGNEEYAKENEATA